LYCRLADDFGSNRSSSNGFSKEVNKQATYQNGVSGNMRTGNIVYICLKLYFQYCLLSSLH
jgi:hypothetical protein